MFTIKGNSRNFSPNIKNLIRQGQTDRVITYFDSVASPDLTDSSNTAMLHLAAKYNNCDLIKYLIKRRCNINIKNDSQMTPLMVAATSSSFKTAHILIEANADIYAMNSLNKSALELLLTNKRIPPYLINCCFKKLESESFNNLMIAENLFIAKCPLNLVMHLKNPRITRMIMKLYGQLDRQQSRAAMDLALKHQDVENVRVLLQSGVEVDVSKTDAVIFLHGIFDDTINLQFMSSFMEKVIDWNCLGEDGLPWIDSIFRFGTKQQIDLFLQHNVNDHVKNKFPGHDLIVNLFGNKHADARELLEHLNFDIHSRGKDCFTALHYAVDEGDLASARMLLELGANPNVEDVEGYVPLYYLDSDPYNDDGLRTNDEGKMAELLLQAGADPQLVMDNDFEVWYEVYNNYTLQALMAQLAIDANIGTPIKETIRQNIIRTQDLKNVFETCIKELEKLKEMKIQGSTTQYTMLVTDAAKLVNKIHDREALESTSSGIDQFHFYYASKLKNSVNRILHTMDLREKASAFICEATGWPNSQYIVLEKILSFLVYKDLLVFDSLF